MTFLNKISKLFFFTLDVLRSNFLFIAIGLFFLVFNEGAIEFLKYSGLVSFFQVSSTKTNDLVVGIGTVLIMAWFAYLSYKDIQLSSSITRLSKQILIILLIVIVINFYSFRYPEIFSKFSLIDLKYINALQLLLYSRLLMLIIILALKKFKSGGKKAHENFNKYDKQYFITDDPLSEDSSNDLSKLPAGEAALRYYPTEYTSRADQIIKRLPPANIRQLSYAIGIIGERGKGKTSFINCLIDRVKLLQDSKFKIIKFEPWLYDSSGKILNGFFQEVIDVVDDPLLDSMLSDYSYLLENTNNYLLDLVRSVCFKTNNAETHRQKICDRLKKLGRELIVVIDDLDRLHKQEILETLKIIRVTLNSPQLIFILGYDKDCINQTIEDVSYIDKMVTTEFRLPNLAIKYSDTKKLPSGILGSLTYLFPISDKQEHTEIYPMLGLSSQGIGPNISEIFLENIQTPRELKKFLNSYRLTREVVLPKIDFDDEMKVVFHQCLFKVEILKLKYYDIYQRIQNRDATIVDVNNNVPAHDDIAQPYCPGIDQSDPNHSKIRRLIKSIFLVGTYDNQTHYDEYYKKKYPNSSIGNQVIHYRSNSTFWNKVFEELF